MWTQCKRFEIDNLQVFLLYRIQSIYCNCFDKNFEYGWHGFMWYNNTLKHWRSDSGTKYLMLTFNYHGAVWTFPKHQLRNFIEFQISGSWLVMWMLFQVFSAGWIWSGQVSNYAACKLLLLPRFHCNLLETVLPFLLDYLVNNHHNNKWFSAFPWISISGLWLVMFMLFQVFTAWWL
jgi:hypothetical protein